MIIIHQEVGDDVICVSYKRLKLKTLFILNKMKEKKESKWKIILDNILIYNLYIIIIGAIFLAISYILSINGFLTLYRVFQKLWYPVFIPSLSLFFTAILVEAVLNSLMNRKNN